jgi:hypothetical protein
MAVSDYLANPTDIIPQGGSALAVAQSISLAFNAGLLAEGALRPNFRVRINPPGEQQVIQIDVTVSEVHSLQAEVTQHPVESGADIADHYRPKPAELRIQGIVTDTPIDGSLGLAVTRALAGPIGTAIGAVQGVAQTFRPSVLRTAFDALRALHDNAVPVQIFTPYKTYVNMLMTDLQVTRDRAGGEALYFTSTFREVFLASSSTTSINVPPANQVPIDMGTQTGKTAPDKLAKQSVAYAGAKQFGWVKP